MSGDQIKKNIYAQRFSPCNIKGLSRAVPETNILIFFRNNIPVGNDSAIE